MRSRRSGSRPSGRCTSGTRCAALSNRYAEPHGYDLHRERSHHVTDTPNSRTEANRSTIRAAFEGWKEGTGAITDVFAPDLVWRIEGHSLASREYRSKQQFIAEVLAPFGARFT